MSKLADQACLTADQYRESNHLDRGVVIHRLFSINPHGRFRWIFDTLVKLDEPVNALGPGCGSAYLRKELTGILEADGEINIPKDVVVFEAVKQENS